MNESHLYIYLYRTRRERTLKKKNPPLKLLKNCSDQLKLKALRELKSNQNITWTILKWVDVQILNW
jgi:hypothetical protein